MLPSCMTAMLVGHRQRLDLVVRHVDRGDAELALEPLELEAHRLAQLGVEVGQRLVEQQQRRLDDEGAREGETLLLAAGQLGRRAGRRSCRSSIVSSTRSRARAISCLARPLPTRPHLSGKATLSNTVMCGQIA